MATAQAASAGNDAADGARRETQRVAKRAGSHSGSCLCGAIRYQVVGDLRPVVACHCTMCRKTSGHFVSATAVERANMTIDEDGALNWYRSSDFARRGFCGTCGSNLFWQRDGAEHISIMAGTLNGMSGLETAAHIHVGEKGDYYRIGDDCPQREDGAHGIWPSS